jgi:hypothetical protein
MQATAELRRADASVCSQCTGQLEPLCVIICGMLPRCLDDNAQSLAEQCNTINYRSLHGP